MDVQRGALSSPATATAWGLLDLSPPVFPPLLALSFFISSPSRDPTPPLPHLHFHNHSSEHAQLLLSVWHVWHFVACAAIFFSPRIILHVMMWLHHRPPALHQC